MILCAASLGKPQRPLQNEDLITFPTAASELGDHAGSSPSKSGHGASGTPLKPPCLALDTPLQVRTDA